MDANAYVVLARRLAARCHDLGLVAPAFRSEAGVHRMLRRHGTLTVVVVDRHHPDDQVIGAMIDGILTTNGRPTDSVMRAALTDSMEHS